MIPKIAVVFGITIFTIEIFLLLDLLVSGLMEKYYKIWPMVDYYCICEYHLKVNSIWPSNTYRVWKVIKHNENCLSRLLYFAGKNISPKWQNYACEEMVKSGRELTNLDWNTYENLTRSDEGQPRKHLNLDDLY